MKLSVWAEYYFSLIAFFLMFGFALPLFASTTTGTISSSANTARFLDSSFGYINMGPTNGGITITDSALTGYAWGDVVGWINFNPVNGGVLNNGEGVLSGYAWGERTGWINFNPTKGGVTINSSGIFSGYAWSQNFGWIVFNCATDNTCSTFNHSVTTDWRPRSARPECNNGSDDDGDGAIDYPADTGCSSLTDTTELSIIPGGGAPGGVIIVVPGGGNAGNTENTQPVPTEPVDICPNLSGIQTIVPSGMITDSFGNCVISVNEDVCPNIPSTQITIPIGMTVDNFGNCIIPEDTTDLCSNIPGQQSTIPAGLVLLNGSCVDITTKSEEPPIIPLVQPTLPEDIINSISEGVSQVVSGTVSGIISLTPTVYKDTVESVLTAYINQIREVGNRVQAIVNDPVASVAVKAVSTAGAVGGGFAAASAIFFNPSSFTEFALIPFRLWTLLLSFLGIKKRSRPWGTVYDSITKQPLDPAYVVLYDQDGKEVTSSITDIDGRFGFLVKPGTYRLVANKTNYTFPSKRMNGKFLDELYSNLYYGEQLVIESESSIINKSIPMDPLKFDWNEFAKKNKKLMRFYSSLDVWILRLSQLLFVGGFFVALIALFAAPQPYNLIIFGLYIALIILRFIGLKPKARGYVAENGTGNPLSFAVVHIFSADLNTEIAKKVTDTIGGYFCLVPNGKYYIKIDRKNSDESYTNIFTSKVFSVDNGIINKYFTV